jgi:MYXO-CTERM domain-containing protein
VNRHHPRTSSARATVITAAAALAAALGVFSRPAPAQNIVLPGTQPGGLTTPLAAAAQCSECHSMLTTSDGRPYMPADLWPASMMANAVRDPLFIATLADAEQDHPGLGQYCLRCHTPAGFTDGNAMSGDPAQLDRFTDMDGVHCDTCHRSIDASATDPMAPYIGNARLYFQDAPAGTSPTRHGPRTDPLLSPRHPSVGDPFIRDARTCGQCHDVDNPLVHRRLPDGTDTGANFPLQSTYSEWAQSDFARRTTPRTCQDCHMPTESAALPVSTIPGSPLRSDHHRHDFVGANEWGMAMLRAAFPGELDDQYDALRTRSQDFLRGAARLEIVALPTDARAGDTVQLSVRVTNLTGHKLPTGYEDSRQMWIQVEAGGRVVTGAMANDDLVEDAQLRIYRFVPGHLESGRVVPDDFVARHEVVAEDTRIPPQGMMPDARTMPVGRDYSGGPGGTLRNDDTATFNVPVAAAPGPMPVTVRLMYRTTTRHYVETIAGANHSNTAGQHLLDVWNAAGRSAPFTMATQQAMVQVTGTAPSDGGADAAGPDAAGARDGGADGGTVTPPGGCGCATPGQSSTGGRAVSSVLFALFVAAGGALRRARRRRTARRVD